MANPFEKVDEAAGLILGAAEAVSGRDDGFIKMIAGMLVNSNAELFRNVGIAAGEVADLIIEEARKSADLIREDDVVDLAEFRRAATYKAICPECHTVTAVSGRATTRPPLCACNTRMVAMRTT